MTARFERRPATAIPKQARHIRLFIDEDVSVIDHTSFEILHEFKNEIERVGDSKVEFVGLDRMRGLSPHESSFRLGYRFPTVSND